MKSESEIKEAVSKLYTIYDRNEYGPDREHVERVIGALEWVLGDQDVVDELLELLL